MEDLTQLLFRYFDYDFALVDLLYLIIENVYEEGDEYVVRVKGDRLTSYVPNERIRFSIHIEDRCYVLKYKNKHKSYNLSEEYNEFDVIEAAKDCKSYFLNGCRQPRKRRKASKTTLRGGKSDTKAVNSSSLPEGKLTAGMIGKELGLMAKDVNLKLLDQGFLKGQPGNWSMTNKGLRFGEIYEGIRDGKEYKNIAWDKEIIDILR
jgi:hypothetical protein